MNRIQIGGYTRITKKEAARRYNAGEVIRLTACKLSPVSPWGCHSDTQKDHNATVSEDGFNTTVARNRKFETVVNAFTYYNCTNETGKYPAYWKKEA